MNNYILIIGPYPPPIGGVSIHTSRLLDLCEKLNVNYRFYDYTNFNFFTFLKEIISSKKSHLHANNPLLLFLYSIICFFLKKHSIITIHGDIRSWNVFFTFFEKWAIQLCTVPIVLNNYSYEIAKKINSNTIKLSAFIPPIKSSVLSSEILNKIESTGEKEKVLFCTNAYDYVFDKKGNEIYGILFLIDIFNKLPLKRLIISDPKGSYFSHVKTAKPKVRENITFLTGNHSFFEVFKVSNCFIRNTSTDGDSLSVKEALHLGVDVIATDCVDRPKGVNLIRLNNILSLENALNEIDGNKTSKILTPINNGGIDIVKLYNFEN